MEEKSIDGIRVVKVIGKNLIISLLLSLIGMFILAVILSKTGVSDSIMGKAIIGISASAICFSGFLTSKKLEMKGILCGILQGILYMVLLYTISSIASGNFSLKLEGIVMIIVGIVSGGIGGIIGANLK